jgi:hypothetical protein
MGKSVPQDFKLLRIEPSKLIDTQKLMQQRHDGIPPQLMQRQQPIASHRPRAKG